MIRLDNCLSDQEINTRCKIGLIAELYKDERFFYVKKEVLEKLYEVNDLRRTPNPVKNLLLDRVVVEFNRKYHVNYF